MSCGGCTVAKNTVLSLDFTFSHGSNVLSLGVQVIRPINMNVNVKYEQNICLLMLNTCTNKHFGGYSIVEHRSV